MKLFLFRNKDNTISKVKKENYLEMKSKLKYLEYYFMANKSNEIQLSKSMKKKIIYFIYNNRYEELKNVEYSLNKKKVKMPQKNMLEMREFALYSDELKKKLNTK